MTSSERGWLIGLVAVLAALVAVSWSWRGDDEEKIFRSEITAQARMILIQSAWTDMATQSAAPVLPFQLMEELERSRADRIYRVIIEAEVGSQKRALELLATLPEDVTDGPILRRLYEDGELTVGEREGLVERWGWFGRIAGIYGLEESDARRDEIWEPIGGTARRMIAVGAIGLCACLAGFVLFTMLLVRLKRGQITARFALHDEGAGDIVWLQTLVLGLAAVLLLNIGVLQYVGLPSGVVMWLPLLAVFWPLWSGVGRGVGRREWAGGIGLLRGEGLLRESAAGVVGCVTGLPLILLGMLATAQLYALTGYKPTLIRGAFYRYLRPRFSVVGSVSISAFVFAVIHPQGLVGIPAIWAMGAVFAGLREWRGSIVPCMVAHAIHNGVLVTMIL